MRSCLRAPAGTQRLLLAAVAGLLIATASLPARGQAAPPGSPSTSRPIETESVAAALRRLRRISAKEATTEQLALRAGLDFCKAVGKPNADAAVRLVDVVGYQALPLSGPLPEKPEKPIQPDRLAATIKARQSARVGELAADFFHLCHRDDLPRSFSAVAQWMLPQDFALVIEQADRDTPNWVTRRCCLVIRVRGSRPSIVGGNLFDALEQPKRKPGPG